MRNMRAIAFVLISAAWAVSMGLLVSEHYALAEPTEQVFEPQAYMFEESWMGMYMYGQKMGYTRSKLTSLPGGYIIDEYALMQVKVLAQQRRVEMEVKASLDKGFKLESFDATMHGDAEMRIRGTVKGDVMEFEIISQGSTRTMQLKMEERAALEHMLGMKLASGGFQEGEEVSIPVVDPFSLAVNRMSMRVAGKERIMSMGSMREVYRLAGDASGMDITMWVTPEGELLKQETGMGVTFIKETRGDAVRLDADSPDLIFSSRVEIDRRLPRGVRAMRVRISGIDASRFMLDGGYQSFQDGVLTIKNLTKPEELAPEQRERYLEPTSLVQSDDPRIRALALEITGDDADEKKRARLIYDWVYENLEKIPAITIPSALEVLDSMRGDCNEHTTLYTALARAAGVPTRMATGLVYARDGFYYHAWPEVYVGGWMGIDPALGQFPADATHIRLLTGGLDRQSGILGVMGRIKLEVLATDVWF